MTQQKAETIVSPVGTAAYSWLLKPDTAFNQNHYKVTLLLDKADRSPHIHKRVALPAAQRVVNDAGVEERLLAEHTTKRVVELRRLAQEREATATIDDHKDGKLQMETADGHIRWPQQMDTTDARRCPEDGRSERSDVYAFGIPMLQPRESTGPNIRSAHRAAESLV